jgi:hypothetical protein
LKLQFLAGNKGKILAGRFSRFLAGTRNIAYVFFKRSNQQPTRPVKIHQQEDPLHFPFFLYSKPIEEQNPHRPIEEAIIMSEAFDVDAPTLSRYVMQNTKDHEREFEPKIAVPVVN